MSYDAGGADGVVSVSLLIGGKAPALPIRGNFVPFCPSVSNFGTLPFVVQLVLNGGILLFKEGNIPFLSFGNVSDVVWKRLNQCMISIYKEGYRRYML